MLKQDYVIWKQNWRCKKGELDILAIKNRTLHLVEVKTRIVGRHRFTPLDQMTERKRQKLRELARYIEKNEVIALRRRRIRKVQIDFIGVEIQSGWIPRYTILHMEAIIGESTNHSHYDRKENLPYRNVH